MRIPTLHILIHDIAMCALGTAQTSGSAHMDVQYMLYGVIVEGCSLYTHCTACVACIWIG